MASRFGFTERARRSLTSAQEEAQHFDHDYIGTEHLLLGLVGQREGGAAKVLTSLGVKLTEVRSAVKFTIANGRGHQSEPGETGLTPSATRVIELAFDEACNLTQNYVGTEHLLLSLLRVKKGVAARILERLGIDLERARAETIRILNQSAIRKVGPLVGPYW